MSREELDRFLTDESRAKVEQFMAESADGDDDVDIDEVIRQNLADHATALHGPTDASTSEPPATSLGASSSQPVEPMPDERLAEINTEIIDQQDLRYPSRPIWWAARDLYAEVTRLRAVETKLRAAVADEHTRLSQEMENEAEFLRSAIENEPYPTAEAYARACHDCDRARAELAEMRAADNENIGTEKRPLAKHELREVGRAVINPAKYGDVQWNHDIVGRMYWALMQQRGEAMVAQRELAEMRATARDLIGENEQLRAELVKVGEELAEAREQHQPGPSLHAWHGPSGEYVHGDQGWIRAKVRRHGGTHVASETCIYQGEWREVPDDGR